MQLLLHLSTEARHQWLTLRRVLWKSIKFLPRWHAGYSIKRISRSLQIDRKTVRRYIRAATKEGLSRDELLPEREFLLVLIEPLLP